MMMNTPRPFIDPQAKENSDDADEYNGTTISPSEAARIRAEVQGVMKQQFAQARANATAISNLEKKLAAQVSTSRSGEATADGDVIDLITQSATSLQISQPSILPSSPISVASTPSQAGNGGSAPGFSHLSSASHHSPSPPHFSTM